MANTIAVSAVKQGATQFQGAFKDAFLVTGSVTDSDAVALTAIGEFDMAVPGVALGDMVLGISFTLDFDDGTDQALASAHVSAADVVTVQWHADNAEFAADALNTAVVKLMVLRPTW